MTNHDTAKARLVQTFRYLKRLNELRNPVPQRLDAYQQVLRIDEWPKHASIVVRDGDDTEDTHPESTSQDVEPIIRIGRAILTPCPEPPEEIAEWLETGWKSADREVQAILHKENFDSLTGTVIEETFDASEERLNALANWKYIRGKWAEKELPALAARKLFETIYLLYTTLSRDGDRLELILADGMLSLGKHDIKHPILLQSISLVFDPDIPEFSFTSDIEKIELHSAMLRQISIVESNMIANLQQQLDSEPIEPLGGSETKQFFQRVMQGLFKDGEFLEAKDTLINPSVPCLWRAPVIFVRPRAAGLSTTLDNVIEDLESEKSEVPSGLGRIMGIEFDPNHSNIFVEEDDENGPNQSPRQTDILFTKQANSEQIKIANRIEYAKSIIVQGPPGTGKTHTIANLIGHLLSEGKTVLVTAHTTKALRVLREKVDELLQPLCISVLHRDSNRQGQLQHVAQEIINRLSQSDPSELRQKAADLRAQRAKLVQEIEKLKLDLRNAKNSEVDEIIYAGKTFRPIRVAKLLKERKEKDSWIPGPLEQNKECPIDATDVSTIYDLHRDMTPSDEKELNVDQPKTSEIISPNEFRKLVAEHQNLDEQAQAHRPELWDDISNERTSDQLVQLIKGVQSAVKTLTDDRIWLGEVLYAGWIGGELSKTWEDLLIAMHALTEHAAKSFRLESTHGPQLPEGDKIEELIPTLVQIVNYMESGKALVGLKRFMKPKWRRVAESCRVARGHPTGLEEFRALQYKATLLRDRELFVKRWSRTVKSHDGPSIESGRDAPERSAQKWEMEIKARLEWKTEVWKPLSNQFSLVGFSWVRWLNVCGAEASNCGDLDIVRGALTRDLVQIIEAQLARVRQVERTRNLQSQREYLERFPRSRIATDIRDAQDTWDVQAYQAAYGELARLCDLMSRFENRETLLNRLKPLAPAWVDAIRKREEPHDKSLPPGNHFEAWEWRQLYQELENRAAVSINDLQDEYRIVKRSTQKLAAEIIDCEAWASQRVRTSLAQQQALAGFAQTIEKIGKGLGKRAPRLRRKARQLLADARSAVPVWIMPLSRVYESFDPRRDKFDVVIIDEASQSDVTALAALYLGRSHVVVGDKEQVTPDAVGQRIDQVERLIETDLQNIPNRHLYDGQISIYDLAEAAFGGVIALRQHFRSVPDIIQFSNRLSYNNRIEPLREGSSANVAPALVSQRVRGYRTDRTNPVEADEVASLILACLEDEQYEFNEAGEPTSYGVISLVGDQQALLIDQILREHVSPDIHEKHRILCGSAAQFQGDERDVVFLSMVDSPPSEGRLAFRGDGPQNVFKKRFNVAVSRARNQLWVVHSVDPSEHLKANDLRRRLIEHARDPSVLWRQFAEQVDRVESEFEKQVLDILIGHGYRVTPQWQVGKFRIDLVVEGRHRRLAVECDGERYHSTEEDRSSDFARQALLEEQGWIFARIRGSLFFRDPERAMKPVLAKLKSLGIEPQEMPLHESDVPSSVKNVRRRAEELRQEWTDVEESNSSDDA